MATRDKGKAISTSSASGWNVPKTGAARDAFRDRRGPDHDAFLDRQAHATQTSHHENAVRLTGGPEGN